MGLGHGATPIARSRGAAGGGFSALRSRGVVCGAVGWLLLVLLAGMADTAWASGWSIQYAPTPTGAKESVLISVSCTSESACTAVGSFDNKALVERWDGSGWSAQRPETRARWNGSFLQGVSCFSRTRCTAVGYFVDHRGCQEELAERWNGSKWSIQPTPDSWIKPTPGNQGCYRTREGGFGETVGADFRSVSCISVTACLAVGAVDYSGYGAADYSGSGNTGDPIAKPATSYGYEEPLVERWNGSKWSIQIAGYTKAWQDGAISSVSCTSATACSAVGGQQLGRWNGKKWSTQNVRSEDSLSGMSCTSQTACTAVGSRLTQAAAGLPLAERWNGSTWSTQRPVKPARSTDTYLSPVSCTSSRDCTAAGNYRNRAYDQLPLIERWNGTSWSIQAAAGPKDTDLTGVSCASATVCVAVGHSVNVLLVESTIAPTGGLG